MKNVSQKHSQRFTKATAQACLYARMNESPNDFFKIMNATFVDNRFIPTLLGYSGSDTRGVLQVF
jgi:hypothetical protein